MTNIWDQPSVFKADAPVDMAVRIKWLAEHPTVSAITFDRIFMTKRGVLPVADAVASCLPGAHMSGPHTGLIYIQNDEALVAVTNSNQRTRTYWDDDFDDYTSDDPPPDFQRPSSMLKTMSVTVSVTSSRPHIEAIFSKVDQSFKKERQAQIKWWFKGDKMSISYKNIYLPTLTTKLHPTFYPDLNEEPAAFMQNYLKSEASVLLLAGPPGTGKTTLLRHLINDFSLAAHVLFDEEIMNTDKVFQSFLFEDESDIMIIEDADNLLQSREDDGNKMMQRFLSVSDGLIKLPNKKLVFTTNMTDFSRVDSALLRPGRCFGRTHTRALNYSEAIMAAKAAGLPAPEKKHEYTLAELFNEGTAPMVRKIGFV